MNIGFKELNLDDVKEIVREVINKGPTHFSFICDEKLGAQNYVVWKEIEFFHA